MRASLCPTYWLFSFSLQILIATGHRKIYTDTMKAYQKQYNYHLHRHQCQLGHVTPGNALLISAVCISMEYYLHNWSDLHSCAEQWASSCIVQGCHCDLNWTKEELHGKN